MTELEHTLAAYGEAFAAESEHVGLARRRGALEFLSRLKRQLRQVQG
jgi:hypothetical protein